MSAWTLLVNGESRSVRSDPTTPLIFVLRNEFGLIGTKLGCGLEQCGACAVLVDGKSVLSCAAPAGQFAGQEIRTVEDRDETLLAVQHAFVASRAAQCGYCVPGMTIALTALLKSHPRPDEASIRAALQPHLCRCGTHARILRAARSLAARGAPA